MGFYLNKTAYNRIFSALYRAINGLNEEAHTANIEQPSIVVTAPEEDTESSSGSSSNQQQTPTKQQWPIVVRKAAVIYSDSSSSSSHHRRSHSFRHFVRSTFRSRSKSANRSSFTKSYPEEKKQRRSRTGSGLLRRVKRRSQVMTEIRLSGSRTMSLEAFATRLNDYNTYHQGGAEELRQRQNRKGELVIDGLLNIYWGLKTTIRLQVADSLSLKIRPRIENIDENEKMKSKPSVQTNNETPQEKEALAKPPPPSPATAAAPTTPNTTDHETVSNQDSNEGGFRQRSVVLRRNKRTSSRVAAARRASINGHFYNHETSMFTPTHGSVTKVRVLSTNNASDVVSKLFQKFRVENSPEKFSLYIVKETEERRELPHDEFPLISRVLVGPNEQVGKIYIMEKKMHQEITQEVAQYIKFDPNILRVILSKFHEEEEKEIVKMKKRLDLYRKNLKIYIKKMEMT